MDRAVLHCDLNNFFASVACRDDASLVGHPVAVGGSTSDRHGIILAKNELAKAFRVQTGEALWQAKQKCPGLIIVPPDYRRYQYFSLMVRDIYSEYTDLIEPFGIDECWIDVTSSRTLFGNEDLIANTIREKVKAETGLTISVGVSFTKTFAKIGSDMKKPDAVTVIDRGHFKNIIWPMPVSTIIGIGPATTKRLRDIGVFTLGDLAEASPYALKEKLGKNGEMLRLYANGMDESLVCHILDETRPKSVGRSITCKRDLASHSEAANVLLYLSEEVAAELRGQCLAAKGVTVHIRTTDLEVNELQAPLPYPTQLADRLAEHGIRLFAQGYRMQKPIRSIGIRAINLVDESEQYQMSLVDDREYDMALLRVEKSVDLIRGKYGKRSVVRASLLNREASPLPNGHLKACFNHIIDSG